MEKKRIAGTKGIKQHLPAFLSLMEMATCSSRGQCCSLSNSLFDLMFFL